MHFHRHPRKRAEVPIVPMIDILFILLVFFIVSTTFKKPRNVLRIEIPTVREIPSDQVADARSVIAVDALGNVTLDSLAVPEGLLQSYLAAYQKQNPGRKLELEADKKLPLERLLQVWDALTQAGIPVIQDGLYGEHTARAVAGPLGLDEVRSGVSPADKLARITALRTAGGVVAMAGDGINDAPALAAADVGIAMGTGTDVAMESAGITLLHGDMHGLVRAVRLSRALMKNIRQNLFLALVYNAVGVLVAAGALYPLTGWLLNPMVAGVAMCLSSISVITNALRLRRVDLTETAG